MSPPPIPALIAVFLFGLAAARGRQPADQALVIAASLMLALVAWVVGELVRG